MYPCGDHAVTIELGDTISILTHQKVISVFNYLREHQIAGIKDLIPAYHTLTLIYDTAFLKDSIPTQTVYEWICEQVQQAIEICEMGILKKTIPIHIPVCYDISLAPDLLSLANTHQLAIEEVIQLHTKKTYQVFMIGFLPGFAYMGSVPEKINTPRKASPRTKVPGGSVGIAGEQTGIYPFDSPGGWQLIGQTPMRMFIPNQEAPCRLQPGDEVSFYPISLADFQQMKNT